MSYSRRNRKSSKRKKWLITTLVFIILILGIGTGFVAYLYKQANDMVADSHEEVRRDDEKSIFRDKKVDPVEDNVSVLFIGVDDSDHRDMGNSRSDALILATFNKKENTVKLLSIPRDSYVYIPEVGYSTKINHAHAYGGPRATIETIEDFLEVPVDFYVQMNFNAFVDIVDAIDGIEFDVPYEIHEQNSNDEKDAIHLMPGKQHLNGEEALALARTRKYDSDVERGKRQQAILKEIVNKTTSASTLFKLEDVLKAVGSNMKTNLRMAEIRGFISYAMTDNIQIETLTLGGEADYVSGGWYYLVDDISRYEIHQELTEHLELNNYADDQSKVELSAHPDSTYN